VAVTDWKSSPSAADLDPSKPGLEVTGGRVKGVYAFGSALSTLWNRELGDGDFNFGSTAGNRASPAIADIDGDGHLEVIMGIEGEMQPGIVVLDGKTGEPEWGFEIDPPGLASSPAVGDIDGDGALEIVFWGFNGILYALDSEACQP
jgi:outer membrane protein assembly factor BamB